MSNNSDPLFDRYVDMDFANAKPVADIPPNRSISPSASVFDNTPTPLVY